LTAGHEVAVIGLGKMGISHLAIANATPSLKVVAACDSSTLLGGMIEKYTGIPFHSRIEDLAAYPNLKAVIIATPTRLHAGMIRQALERGLHIFCEKPMTLSAAESAELDALAKAGGLRCAVGYHNRFVGTFATARDLLIKGVIGRVRHVHAEAYGPVVLKPAAKTWRSKSQEGGGCLYDYAAHPINLMNWYVGRPIGCSGAQLTRQWSSEVDDAVYANLLFANDTSGQVSVNWADETARKMTTRVTIWGDGGKIVVDRQEIQVFIGARGKPMPGYRFGWTVKYITELTPHPEFYLRGEEYSAQLENFGRMIGDPTIENVNDFASAADTDHTLELIRSAAQTFAEPQPFITATVVPAAAQRRRFGLFGRVPSTT